MACLNLATCWHASQAQDASKTFTRRPQDGQRGPQDTRRRTLDAPKTPPGRFQDGPRCPKTPLRHPTRPSGRSKTPPRCSKTSPRHPKAPPDLDFGPVAPGFLKLVGPPDPTLDSLKLHVGWFYDLWPTACQITYVNLLSGSPLPTLPPAAPTCMTTMQKLMPQISIALRFLHSLSDTAINYFIT